MIMEAFPQSHTLYPLRSTNSEALKEGGGRKGRQGCRKKEPWIKTLVA
jgi:hypothetical protein